MARLIWTSVLLISGLPYEVCFAAGDEYALVIGNTNIGRVDLYDMSREGKLSFRSDFDIWDDTERFADPWDLVVSESGNYCFLYDWNQENGALYSIDETYGFDFMREIQNGCAGGGFTPDEQYLFTVTNCAGSGPSTYTLQAYALDTHASDLVTSQSIPYYETIAWNYQVTSDDEVIGGGRFGFSPDAFRVYQFDRSSQELTLKQQIKDEKFFFSDMHADSFLVYTLRSHIAIISRGADGVFAVRDSYWNTDWPLGTVGWAADITPDARLAFVLLSGAFDMPSGPVVFSIGSNHTLQYLTRYQRGACGAQAMTPDGRFLVVSWNYGRTLTVFQILSEFPYLQETSTIQHSPGAFCMEFLPQAKPNAVGDGWDQYVDQGRLAIEQETTLVSAPALSR